MAQEKELEFLGDRSVIKISGADSGQFLQNITTNNIDLDFCYSCMLNSKGKYLFDFFLINQGAQGFLVDIAKNKADDFIKRAQFLKLASDVQIDDLSQKLCVAYGRSAPDKVHLSFQDPRYKEMGVRSIVDAGHVNTSKCEMYLEDKYKFAVPDGAEMISEKSIILEYGMHHLMAVDFNKGCYTGQELISRTYNMGVVRKKIFKIIADSPIKADPGDKVLVGDQEVGQIRSCYKNSAIGLLNEQKLRTNAAERGYIIAQGGARTDISISTPLWRLAR